MHDVNMTYSKSTNSALCRMDYFDLASLNYNRPSIRLLIIFYWPMVQNHNTRTHTQVSTNEYMLCFRKSIVLSG